MDHGTAGAVTGNAGRISHPRARRCERATRYGGIITRQIEAPGALNHQESRITMHRICYGLKDKVCLITGAAQGIGEACARLFAQEGAQVVLTDVLQAQGQALAEQLQAQGADARFVACDVGDKAQVDAMLSQVLAACGRVDVLVSNAGIFRLSLIHI